MSSSRAKAVFTWIFLVIFALAAVGLIGGNYYYIKQHLPLLRAERVAAEKEGASMLGEIGVPPGAAPMAAVEQNLVFGSHNSMWGDEPIGMTWVGFWDAPGDHPAIDEWYHAKLLADGWQLFDTRVPSTVQTQYWRDKWLLTVEHEATFATEHPPHARYRLRLTWDYLHSLDRSKRGIIDRF